MRNFQKNWQNILTHPVVRDLAWALFSPSLLTEKAELNVMNGHFLGIPDAALDLFCTHLRRLDKEPSPLLQAIEQKGKGGGEKRLGSYFETLIGYFLSTLTCCHKLEQKVLVHEPQGNKTVGEFDFLFFSDQIQQMVHWEVAVKFYLLHGPANEFSSYIGTNAHDNLEEKILTLRRQLFLPREPAGKRFLQANQLIPISSGALIKGYLFYPLEELTASKAIPPGINEGHLSGLWARIDDPSWKSFVANYKPVVLARHEWFSPRNFSSAPDPLDLREIQTPSLLGCFIEEDGIWKERERLMIVGSNWPQISTK